MNGTAYGPDLSLTADQEDLLRTALSSNTKDSPQWSERALDGENGHSDPYVQLKEAMANGSNLNTTTMQDPPNLETHTSLDNSPLFENYDFEDGNYEWDNKGDQLFTDIPGNDFNDDSDIHDKRKASTESDDGEPGTSKRQEGEGKPAKKPGRKPLTAEPTTKRKAQNRAAQRAFRERKERHLKDLEIKVDDLEKASEATNHENGRLRAQVEKLNMELTEYRKRLSLSNTATGHSPPLAASQNRTQQNGNGNDFQFAFPKFGDLPGVSFLNNGSLAKTKLSSQTGQSTATGSSHPSVLRKASSNSGEAISPSNTNGLSRAPLSETRPYQASANRLDKINNTYFNGLTSLFSPSVLETASRSDSSDYTSHQSRQSPNDSVKQSSFSSINGASQASKVVRASPASMTNSPTSSMSHAGLDSSCGTTPEPSAGSPDNRKASEGVLNTISEESVAQNAIGVPSTVLRSPVSDINGIDWMAQQNGGQFDPVLFGDYRDPQDNILNNTFDDLFNSTFPVQDFASPYNTGDALMPEPKRDLMKEIEIRQNGADDDAVPAEKPQQFLSCEKLWQRVQATDKYKSGEVDMDNLCSELKAKAKCSGKGAVIEESEVDKILGPKHKTTNDMFGMFS